LAGFNSSDSEATPKLARQSETKSEPGAIATGKAFYHAFIALPLLIGVESSAVAIALGSDFVFAVLDEFR
jgi:hypothetical protein